ncbi:MAG: hypothetical protein JJ879_07310, partial [Sneathiella sp.]|nr:hypothetical protein [Sneathiella sp.]
MAVEPGRVFEMDVVLPHAGANHIVLKASERPGEISTLNNMAVAEINAVRDRLKVLLVSGEPHMGERGWRNILKSDPSVDLVHFTILRPPEKQDGTPLNELSLIPFPIMELFERKLHEFDLVVFDRYRKRGVLTNRYLENIVEYVNGGGALLEAAGPSFASPLSLYRTPLASLLPGAPTGAILETRFTPQISAPGTRHPVTGELQINRANEEWGPWFRLIDVNTNGGTVLMTGADEKPLLVLNRFGKGRVAQLTSDHAWLWGRGYQGGGPQAELFRRIAHWLMKEPDLEEEKLSAKRAGSSLEIKRRSMTSDLDNVSVTHPDGSQESVRLSTFEKGVATARTPLKGVGLYQVTSGPLQTLVAIGNLNPIENRNVLATDKKIIALTEQNGGGYIWRSEEALPDLRQVTNGSSYSGRNWWGLRRNEAYEIAGYTTIPLFPLWLAMCVAGLGMLFMWWRESR